MRKRIFILLYLTLLCVLLFCYGWMFKQAEILEEQRARLQQELEQMKLQNAELKEQLKTLQEEKAVVFEQLQQWFDAWETGSFEATAYTLECGNGDGYTATMTVPREGYTVAVDPAIIKLGSKVFIPGLGWRVAEDTGGMIRGEKIDLYMGSGLAARGQAMRFGRKNIKVVYQK